MDNKYEKEILESNPKFNPIMFSMFAHTLFVALPRQIYSTKFLDSKRREQFERIINEIKEKYNQYRKL